MFYKLLDKLEEYYSTSKFLIRHEVFWILVLCNSIFHHSLLLL